MTQYLKEGHEKRHEKCTLVVDHSAATSSNCGDLLKLSDTKQSLERESVAGVMT